MSLNDQFMNNLTMTYMLKNQNSYTIKEFISILFFYINVNKSRLFG